MWAFTGGCHYSAGCKNYEFMWKMPLLNFSPNDFSYKIWIRKKKYYL